MFGRIGAARCVFLQPWLRVHIDNNNKLRWCHWHMHRVWVRLVLQRERRPANRVLLLPWVCINGDDIQCVCHHVFNVRYYRLRTGECLRGRIGAAGALYVQRWVLFRIDHDHHMRWQHRDMRCLRRWFQLCGGQRPGGRVQLFRGPRFDIDGIECLRQYVIHVPRSRVWRGECVRRRIGAAGALYVHRWVCFHIDNDHGMRRQRRDVSCLRCRSELCGG